MRQKRAKAYRKQMNVYVHTFKFREPYQTIVDAALVLQAEKTSFDLSKGLNRTIQAEVKPMITQCCMQELYFSKNQNAIDYAKTFERRRCNHPPSKPIPSSDCIKSVVDVKGENKHRYIVATQDDELRKHLRKVPGVPLVYMNRAVMVMEPLSKSSALIQHVVETKKLTLGLNDSKLAGMPKEEKKEGDSSSDKTDAPQPKKRKGPKGPNPLSVKKKKVSNEQEQKKEQNGDTSETAGKKRRRRHHGKAHDGSNDEDKEDHGEEIEDENVSE